MSGQFIGSSDNAISNNRITVPAKFKKKFSPSAKETVIVTVGLTNDHIAIFPLDYWNNLCQKLRNGSQDQREALQSYFDYAEDQKIEAHGRIRLKNDILNMTGIKNKIIIKGEGSYFSLWEPEAFNAKREARRKRLLENNHEMDFLL